MNSQRRGSALKIQIRMALTALGRDPNSVSFTGKSIKELGEIAADLHREYERERGGRLVPHHGSGPDNQ